MKLAAIGRVAALLAVTVFAAQYLGWIDLSPRAGPTPPVSVSCPALEQGCAFTLDTVHYRLESDQPLATNRIFRLSLHGPAQTVEAEWRMAEMDMGPNRRPMQPYGDSQWQLQTALPFCSAARRDWQLILLIDDRRIVIETRSTG
ncbi:hypothetical protein [Chitiniphilus eburneus]|uniref:Uncharacterized protein n=1 Tax=Chitiniphilus eburneus TaxID=2571148 RepID=A0A4U0Q365_9NEIS|nr:hypothetical protein [Chitiniphilus eburneus]TJZ75521.1 hypothetical protein FAZ21_06295 [Chitiniphilus eburneus]